LAILEPSALALAVLYITSVLLIFTLIIPLFLYVKLPYQTTNSAKFPFNQQKLQA